jgi:hypothetical protein
MPAKVTSRIAWKSEEQKERARKIADQCEGSLSAHIQKMYEAYPDPLPSQTDGR